MLRYKLSRDLRFTLVTPGSMRSTLPAGRGFGVGSGGGTARPTSCIALQSPSLKGVIMQSKSLKPSPLSVWFHDKRGPPTDSIQIVRPIPVLQTRQHHIAPIARSQNLHTPAPRKLATKKPDGIVFEPDGEVAAVVEFKPPSELATRMAVAKAVSQELEVARFLGKLLVVTSGETTFWINALNGERVLSE